MLISLLVMNLLKGETERKLSLGLVSVGLIGLGLLFLKRCKCMMFDVNYERGKSFMPLSNWVWFAILTCCVSTSYHMIL